VAVTTTSSKEPLFAASPSAVAGAAKDAEPHNSWPATRVGTKNLCIRSERIPHTRFISVPPPEQLQTRFF
jgi:hypothetical protein